MVGQLTVQETETTLIIGIEATEGLEFSENHLYVGALEDAPLKNGNSAPGKFANSGEETASAVYYVFNKADLPLTLADEDLASGGLDYSGCFVIAFHTVIGDETVWSTGSGFNGRNWATFTELCLKKN